MAYVQLIEFDVDLETHKRIGEVMGDEPVKGLIVHVAGDSPNGVYSLDVWESKDDADRFFAEQMMPALEKLDLGGGPPVSFQDFEAPFVIRS